MRIGKQLLEEKLQYCAQIYFTVLKDFGHFDPKISAETYLQRDPIPCHCSHPGIYSHVQLFPQIFFNLRSIFPTVIVYSSIKNVTAASDAENERH